MAHVYSFAVYEDDVLTHRYTPCVENGVAGVDGGGMAFTEHPQGGRLSRGHTLTLTAFAPGAAGYQWLKNGAIVEGATGRTLEWRTARAARRTRTSASRTTISSATASLKWRRSRTCPAPRR